MRSDSRAAAAAPIAQAAAAPSRGRAGAARQLAAALAPAAALAAAALLCACSFDYGSASGAEGPEEPSFVFRDFSHSVVIEGRLAFELRAKLAEGYAESKRTVLTEVSFTEYERGTGEVANEGRADGAVLYDETEDAEFSGSIRIDSRREGAVVEAEYLAWDSSERRLESRLDRNVSVSRDDGSWMRGAGFSADARRRSFAFRDSVEGYVVVEEDEAAGAEAAADASGAAPAEGPLR